MALLLTNSDLADANQAFFGMVQREFTKLQILLPGETAAPGTPSGKTRTPTPKTLGVEFDVVVNAVDSAWHLVTPGRDTVSISCSDPPAFVPPIPASLLNGTMTFTVALPDVGTFTLMATDDTDGSKAPDTSSPVISN